MFRQPSVARSISGPQPSKAEAHELLPIDVVLDTAALTLTVSSPDQELTDHTDLVWRFFYLKEGSKVPGLPPGWAPNIFFVDGPKDLHPKRPPLYEGPFSSLRVAPLGVLGRGRSGVPGTYVYRALVLNGAGGRGGVIASPDQRLVSTSSEQKALPEVSIGVNLLKQEVEIFPLGVRIYPEEPLSWHFVDLPSGFQPAIRFTGSSSRTPLPPMETFFGPFESLCTYDKLVMGTGRNGALGRFEYTILLVDEAGNELELFGSPDPHIDTEPDPFENPQDPTDPATG